jgi:hypothetical protein
MANLPPDRWMLVITDSEDDTVTTNPRFETARKILRVLARDLAGDRDIDHFEFMVGGPRPQ